MSLRKIIFWLHLVVGVVAGVIILVMSATGVLLAYEKQITAWFDGSRVQPPSSEAQRLPASQLLAKASEAQPDIAPTGLTLRSDPTAPALVNLGREKALFLDPYTGAVLGEGASSARAFFRFVNGCHRWLAMDGDRRVMGRNITGACNLAFLGLVISGFYLWMPRRWNWGAVRAVVLFNARLRGKARDWNWHNVIGAWSALPLFFIVLTGVVMSYPWANNLIYRLTGSEPPPAREGAGRQGGGPEGQRAESGQRRNRGDRQEGRGGGDSQRKAAGSLANVDAIWARAEQQAPGWKSINLRLPASGSGPVNISIDLGNAGRPDLRTQLTFDAKTGELTKAEPFSSYNLGRKLRTWGRWVHTGEAGGWIGQTIAALASAGAVMLVWTGLSLACRRFLARARPISEPVSAETPLPVEANRP